MCDFSSSIHYLSFPLLAHANSMVDTPVDSQMQQQPSNGRRLGSNSSLVDPKPISLDTRFITTEWIDELLGNPNLLTQAIQDENITEVNHLIHDKKLDPNALDDKGLRPLSIALDKKNYEIIRLLLRHPKIDIELIDEEDMNSLEDNLCLRPLLINPYRLDIPEEKKDLLASLTHLKSSYDTWIRLSTLFHMPKFRLEKPFEVQNDNEFLNDVFDIKNPGNRASLAGTANPDRMWATLEQAWVEIADELPESSAYFKDSVDDLIDRIHTGAISDAKKIAHAIKHNKPVSFIVELPNHVMSISVYDNVLIFTNLGGGFDLKTGDQIADNSCLGKRIIQLRPADKARLTAECIQSLQICESKAIKTIFKMPVIGFIRYKGQKRGNCAGTHPKSIWEDQLWFAHIQKMEQRPLAFFKELFQGIEPNGGFKSIQRQDLFKTRLEPAVEVFKMLTLTARKAVARQWTQDEHAVAFLSSQLKLALGDSTNDQQAEQSATAIHVAVTRIVKSTLTRMLANQMHHQLVKDQQQAEHQKRTSGKPKKQSEKRMSVKKVANETSRSINVRQSPRLMNQKQASAGAIVGSRYSSV